MPVKKKLGEMADAVGYHVGSNVKKAAKAVSYHFEDKLKYFTPSASNQFYREYSGSLNDIPTLKSTPLFNNYIDNHVGSVDALSALTREEKPADEKDAKPAAPASYIKFSDGDTLKTRLEKALPDDQEAVKTLFANALNAENAITAAQTEFNAKISALNALIAQQQPRFEASVVATYVQSAQAEAVQAIKTQHQLEKTRVEALFTDPQQSQTLRATLGLANDDDFNLFKSQTLEALDKKHSSDEQALNSKMSEECRILHADSQNDRDRINLLAVLYRDNAAMRKIIDEAAARRRQEAGDQPEAMNAEIGLDPVNGLATFKGVTVEDLGTITTLTGRKISQAKDPNTGQTIYSFPVPSLVNLNYHFGMGNQLKSDLFLLAMVARAAGKTEVTVNVTHSDEETAMKLARIQYECCLEAGFAPDKVKTKVNGKDVELKDLFAGKENYLENLKSKYQIREQEKEQIRKAPPIKDVQDFKDQIEIIKKQQFEAKQAEEEAAHNADLKDDDVQAPEVFG